MTHQMQQMDAYIQSIVKEYQEKENELQGALLAQKVAEEAQAKAMKENVLMLKEVSGFKERCKALEIEMEVKGKGVKKDQSEEMEFEIRRVRENYQK
jgi:hypothetical protein